MYRVERVQLRSVADTSAQVVARHIQKLVPPSPRYRATNCQSALLIRRVYRMARIHAYCDYRPIRPVLDTYRRNLFASLLCHNFQLFLAAVVAAGYQY